MKWSFFLSLLFLPFLLLAQTKKTKKYPSLLWEISGNGLTKPSYLFGTMHVSSKLAFHLADSFFLGIRNADVVALETNPESWQEDMSNYGGGGNFRNFEGYRVSDYTEVPDDYLRINTLKFYKYDKKIERSLYSNPSAINNLLYRSFGNETSDFEEDTYLDMYIYQCGKKWGKKVAGVEKYAESMKLMMEAYKDAAKDRNIKERSYDGENSYSFNKLQEAYRSGNLDWLDSINRYNSFSAAFDEKFLYRRNEIQAASIDSILRSGQSLFVGVGAAHLPGNRGVIEILRQHGYKLRPIKMGARDSQHKNQVEKVRVAVPFTSQAADDGMYKVDIPGKFYRFGEDPSLDQRQYADMANGSYYMVTRITTNAWMWGHSSERVSRVVDSLLYENVPGKIVSRTRITRNGYQGIDLTNITRRGDWQRYNIFITPFEVIIFKMSGTGEYVKSGEEAKRFFGSIQLKEYRSANDPAMEWKKYSPPFGGFSVDLPHAPHVGNDGSWIYDAADKTGTTFYRIIRTDIHNYHFVEEDSFDLGLMAESFGSSDFISKLESRKQTIFKGYPALDCRYRAKNGSLYLTRFIIRGPHYYTLVAYGKQETPGMTKFLQSFEPASYQYATAVARKDTDLYYTAKSPVFPEPQKEKLDFPRYSNTDDDDEPADDPFLENGAYRSKLIENDSTGEKIHVSFFRMQRYNYIEDSASLAKESQTYFFGDSSGFARSRKNYELPGGMKVWEVIITDTGSSRTVWSKTFYKNGTGYTLITQSDTLSKPSTFVQSFYDSFTPADTFSSINPFQKKSNLFFADFSSNDSVAHKRAVKYIYSVKLDSTDLTPLKQVIGSLGWKEKKYLDTKKQLIGKLRDIKTRQSSLYLKDIYYAAGDTVELQYQALETLLQQETKYAYELFRDIMINDPPVLESSSGNSTTVDYTQYFNNEMRSLKRKFGYNYGNNNFLDGLRDSLKLTATILPDILPLLNVDDYKDDIMQLLAELVDSNLVQKKQYEAYYSKFLLEAKQEMKKQAIAEKKKAIEKAEEIKLSKKNSAASYGSDDDSDLGNAKLRRYTVLLLPYWDTNPAVQTLFKQMWQSGDKRLKYNALLLLLRNNKPYPDSLVKYFAAMNDYRYQLYVDLKEIGKVSHFPALYNNQIDLAKSKLMTSKSYDKPDSLVYIDRLPADIKNRKGNVYFFKYKAKKDDAGWKLAAVGLVPANPALFEFEEKEIKKWTGEFPLSRYAVNRYDISGFSDTRLHDDKPLTAQLHDELKKLIYSLRKSAAEFYNKSDTDEYEAEENVEM